MVAVLGEQDWIQEQFPIVPVRVTAEDRGQLFRHRPSPGARLGYARAMSGAPDPHGVAVLAARR